MPRKVVKRGRDEPQPDVAPQSNTTPTAPPPDASRNVSENTVTGPAAVAAASSAVVTPSSGDTVLDVTLLRTQPCLDLWIALYATSAQDSYSLLTAVLRSETHFATLSSPLPSDAAVERESAAHGDRVTTDARILDRLVRMMATRSVGTIEVLFNDGRDALLTEFGGTSSSPVAATLQSSAVEYAGARGGGGEAVTQPNLSLSTPSSRGSTTGTSTWGGRRTFFPGDVISFVPKTTAPAAATTTAAGSSLLPPPKGNESGDDDDDETAIWLAYQPQRLQDESDRFDAMDHVYREAVFPSVLGLYAAKPGMAQLVAFYRCETSSEWARLLSFGEGILPFPVYGGERHGPAPASSTLAARERLSEATATAALLVGQALRSAYTYCDGMTRPLTKWTLEFVASPLFLAAALHVVQRSSSVNNDSGGGGWDDDRRRLHREWCQVMAFVSDVVWTGFAWRHRFTPWKAASVALGAVFHAASISAQTATTGAEGRELLLQLFYSSFRRFVAWIGSSSARGTTFAPNTSRSTMISSSSTGLPSGSIYPVLDSFLRPPTLTHLLRGEAAAVAPSASAASSIHFRRDVMTSASAGATREKQQQLFHLPPLGQPQTLDFHTWFPSLVTPTPGTTAAVGGADTATTLRLATLWEVYSELYSPIAKALRREIVERRARNEAPEYENLSVDVLPWIVGSAVSVWHDHDLATPNLNTHPPTAAALPNHIVELYRGIQLMRSVPLVLTFGTQREDADMGVEWEGKKGAQRLLPMPWAQLCHDPSQRRSLLGALVLEMSDDSEPLVFCAVLYPHGAPAAAADNENSCNNGPDQKTLSCLVHFLEGGDMVPSLLGTVTEAHRLLRREHEDGGDGVNAEGDEDITGRRALFLPRARFVVATELSGAAEERNIVAQRDAGAVYQLAYLHHLVMQHEGVELSRQLATISSSSSPAWTADGAISATTPTDAVNASGSLLDAVCGGHPLCTVIPRHISPAERESIRKSATRVAAAVGSSARCVSRPGIAECLGSVAAGGPTGIHTVEGVCGSGKTLTAVLAAASHGICRAEGREEQQREGVSSLLEHVSAKVVTTQQQLVSQLQSSSSSSSHHHHRQQSQTTSSSSLYARRNAAAVDIVPMLDARTQQEEEYARYRRQLVIRSPVLALEESRASGSVESICRTLQAQGLLKVGTGDALVSKGRQRSLRSPLRNMMVDEYIRCARTRNLLALLDKLSDPNEDSDPSDANCDIDDEEGAENERFKGGVASFVVPWVAAAALRSLSRNGEAFLRWCCSGVDVSDALRVALGSHNVLMYGGAVHNALRRRRPRQSAARAAATDTPPTVLPPRYRMSSTTASTLSRLVSDFEASPQLRQPGSSASNHRSTMWLSSQHLSSLLDLQRQTLRGALHRLETETSDHFAFMSELIDYVAAFEAQSCDVLCSTDTALLRDVSLYRCGLDVRGACRGALPAITALVVDGVESLLHAPWLTLRAPTYFFSTHSLERLTTAEMRCGWGVSAFMDALIRGPKSATSGSGGGASGAILSLPTTPVSSVASPPPPPQYPTAVSQLKECLRFTSEFTTNATCMMLPPPILRNASTLLPRMAPDVSERIIAAWWTSVVLWSPTHVSSFARRDAAALINAPAESEDGTEGDTRTAVAVGHTPPGGGAGSSSAPSTAVVELVGSEDTELWLALQLAEELAAATGGSQRRAVSGAATSMLDAAAGGDYAGDDSGTCGDTSSSGLRVAVLVPSLFHKAVLRIRRLSTSPIGAGGATTATSSSAVTFGDLFALRGRVFDVVVIAPLGTPRDALWLWRAATRCRMGFAVVSCPSHSSWATSSSSSVMMSKSDTIVGLPSFNPLSLLKTFLHDALVHGRDRQVAKGMVSDVVLHAAGATVGGASSRDVQIDVAVQQRKNHFDTVRFRCPTHAQSVYAMLASISAAASGGGGDSNDNCGILRRRQGGGSSVGTVEVRVEREGVTRCGWICLGRYRACEHPAHRCVRSCHVRAANLSDDVDPSESYSACDEHEDPHAHCPFPCPRTLPCGHRCMATCGEHECPPCGFVGLAELTCGQAVIGGMSGKDVQYVLHHHFQLVGCGHEPQSCSETVSLPCRQCGGKITGTCSDAVNSASWPCSICDGVVAKVRKEFQLEPSSSSFSSAPQPSDATGAIAGDGPKKSDWPAAAKESLEKQLSFLRQKHSLLEKRMALNMAANGTHKNPEFEAESQRVTRQRLEAERLEEAWKQRSSDAKAIWAQRMVTKLETQQEWNRFADAQLKKLVDRLLMTD